MSSKHKKTKKVIGGALIAVSALTLLQISPLSMLFLPLYNNDDKKSKTIAVAAPIVGFLLPIGGIVGGSVLLANANKK